MIQRYTNWYIFFFLIMEQARTALCHYCRAGQRPALLSIERILLCQN